MVYKDEVCMWFKDNESHRRLELLCGLLNMCLPFELRFIRTCVEDLGRDDLLRDFDLKANNSSEISQLGKILDERTRSKFVVYVALLEANNQTCSKILFETLSNAQEIPNSALSNNLSDNINYIKEMLLIYTMVLHHPAFTFEEKRVIGERFQSLQVLEKEISKKPWSNNKPSFGQDLSIESCHTISSPPQVFDTCDSGLSIGTEPEVEVLSDHVCVPTGIHLPHDPSNSSTDNTFNDIAVTQGNPTIGRPTLNPSIGTRNSSEKLPSSSSLINSSESSSIMQHGPPAENRQHGPPNRDASSSGSGESLDLYGESVSVPTTYIYNSNIYDHQNLNEMPTMALSNNLINLTPGYMYQHNGRCHFYQYPPLMGGVLSPSSVPVPRKLPPGGALSSETSSGEEGTNGTVPVTSAKLLLLRSGTAPPYSSLSSSQSSPYASPPQSPKGGTVTTAAPSLASPQGLVTGTTTTIVLSKSSPRPPVKNNSHPSSPGLIPANSQIIPRCKPPVVTKGQKYPVGERPNTSRNRSSPNHCSTESNNSGGGPVANGPTPPPVFVSKENGCGVSGSFPANNKEVLSTCNAAISPNRTYMKSNGRPLENSSSKQGVVSCGGNNNGPLPPQNLDNGIQTANTMLSSVVPETTVVPSSHSFRSICSVPPSASTMVVSVLNGTQQRVCPSNPELAAPVRANNIRNLREENHLKDNSTEEIKAVEEVEKLKSKQEEKDSDFISLPNGFNEYLLISSSAHSVQLKHSISQTTTTSVPSCSCATVSLHSDSCKMSLSPPSNGNRQKIIPPISQSVAGENLIGKPSSVQNRHIVLETTTQNVLPSIAPAVTHTVPSKMSYNNNNSPAPHLSEAPGNNNSSVKISLPSTSPSVISPQSSTQMNTSKYSCGVSNANDITSMNKMNHAENGHQIQVSVPPPGQTYMAGVKPSPTGNTTPTITTTTSSANTTMVSLVPSPGTYSPYFSIPILPGGAPSYLHQGGFPHHTHGHPRTPSHTFFVASPSGVVQAPPGHIIKGNHPHVIPPPPPGSNINHGKSRGTSSGRSGSNSSGSGSSSSGLSRKKVFVRGAPHQSKSRSSDSSPSSSQYSSPPQTPSPDHTKDTRSKSSKAGPGTPGKLSEGGYPIEEVWDPADSNGAPCLPCTGPREEGTPPPHHVGPQIMIPSNPVRQRYFPYHPPLGFIGYPHPHSPHGVYRYSLASPSVVMGPPRPPTPLGSEKSSRETTPPTHSHAPVGPPLEKGVDFTMSTAPSSASPPIPGPMSETTSVALVPPPPGPAAGPIGPPPNGSSIHQYNAPNYPMFAMGAGPFVAHLSGFLPSSSALPNGYVSPHTLPSFPVPSVTPGMTSGGGELMYPPGPFPVMAQTTLATSSSCSGGGGGGGTHPPVLHQSSGGVPAPYTAPPYQTPPPPSSNPVPPPAKKPFTCYNCGKGGHRGYECKEASIDEMTKRTKVS